MLQGTSYPSSPYPSLAWIEDDGVVRCSGVYVLTLLSLPRFRMAQCRGRSVLERIQEEDFRTRFHGNHSRLAPSFVVASLLFTFTDTVGW